MPLPRTRPPLFCPLSPEAGKESEAGNEADERNNNLKMRHWPVRLAQALPQHYLSKNRAQPRVFSLVTLFFAKKKKVTSTGLS
jgi:hypothetical protein